MIWHSTDSKDVLKQLDVDDKKGLSNGVVEMRLEKYGYNIISKIEKPSFFKRFLKELNSKVVIILIITAIISFVVSLVYNDLNSYYPLLIIGIVIINALISAYYIYSGDNTIDKLKNITNPSVSVIRDGIVKNINSSLIVPGDIILLEEGDYISADARIIESSEFRCNESALTDEEVPVEKMADITVDDITSIDKRSNMVYSGCSVVHGTAKAVVVSTGLNTEVGRSSAILQQTGNDVLPLQSELDLISKISNIIILIICIAVFIIGIIENFGAANFASMTLSVLVNAIALGVAAVPEGLPAIATIVIAMGIIGIVREKITIKDVKALELLGKTNVLCCDKTGVLTRNKMQVSKLYDGKKVIDLETVQPDETSLLLIRLATACTTLDNDSTENAIEKACLAYNSMSLKDVEMVFPKLGVIPFDSTRKSMTVITMINEKPFAIVKGAPEIVIPNCINCNVNEHIKANENLANEGLRNVCIAMKPLSTIPANANPSEIEKELTFVGIIGLNDPPRENIIENIKECDSAGIKTVMVTGDNLITSQIIARRIGILKDGTQAVTGDFIDTLTDDELAQSIDKYSVFARICPEHKLRLVKAWQKNKNIVTVTGDSLHDADALSAADVGCAIGRFGTDAAKGNADIVISNNRFDSIVFSIKESRGLFNNIKKCVYYLMSCNLGELLTYLFGMLLFVKTPLAAVHLLWINLLTDSAPAISLSMEKAEDTVMTKKQSVSVRKIFDFVTFLKVLIQGICIGALSLITFKIGLQYSLSVAMTMTFATLGISQIFHCYNIKHEGTIFNKNIFSNKMLNVSALLTLFIMIFLVFTPAGFVFELQILTFKQFIISFLLSLAIIPLSEIIKFVFKKFAE